MTTKSELKVIGAGFGRTGTTSLKAGLEELGFGPCYHMKEVIKGGHVTPWITAAAGNPDWDHIFADYSSAVDFPASGFYKELMEVYPEAKVVLSVRDSPDKWFGSVKDTIFTDEINGAPLGRWFLSFTLGRSFLRMKQATIGPALGGYENAYSEETLKQAYVDWIETVKATVPPERLLVWNVKEGYEPLARFLGVPAPVDANGKICPFPYANDKEEFNQNLVMINRLGLTLLAASALLLGGAAYAAYAYGGLDGLGGEL